MDLEDFLQLVRSHPEIYDSTHPESHNKKLKDKIWDDIGREINLSGPNCKKAWLNLRCSYGRFLRIKERSSGPTRHWRYEKQMSFLLPYLPRKPTVSILDESDKEETDLSESMISTSCLDVRSEEQEHDRKEVTSEQDPLMTTKKKGKEERTDGASSKVEKKDAPPRIVDPLTCFFNAISATVRTFPPYDQHLAKKKIFQIVSDLELSLARKRGESSDVQSTSRSISADFQEESKSVESECSDPFL